MYTEHLQSVMFRSEAPIWYSSLQYKLLWSVSIMVPIHVLSMQEPQAITLGSVLIEKGVGARRRTAEEPEKMVYIPLLETLEAVLQNRNIITEVHIYVCAWSVCRGTQQFYMFQSLCLPHCVCVNSAYLITLIYLQPCAIASLASTGYRPLVNTLLSSTVAWVTIVQPEAHNASTDSHMLKILICVTVMVTSVVSQYM